VITHPYAETLPEDREWVQEARMPFSSTSAHLNEVNIIGLARWCPIIDSHGARTGTLRVLTFQDRGSRRHNLRISFSGARTFGVSGMEAADLS
jgi:hypothetical protein